MFVLLFFPGQACECNNKEWKQPPARASKDDDQAFQKVMLKSMLLISALRLLFHSKEP